MKKKELIIKYNRKKDWWIVTFPHGNSRNYGSFNTLVNVIKDFWKIK